MAPVGGISGIALRAGTPSHAASHVLFFVGLGLLVTA